MDSIDRWRSKGLLDERQAAFLSDIQSGRLFSVSDELRALLYLGALAFIAGVGATVKRWFQHLGHAAIIGGLLAATFACFAYVADRSRPFSRDESESPTAAFDYILFVACALIGVLFAYVETHFKVLGEYRDVYLLVSGALFVALSYRYDNRIVLGMGLLNFGAWLGLRLNHWFAFGVESMRWLAIVYGSLVVLAGWLTHESGLKKHFRETYFTIGLNVLFIALVSGVDRSFLYLPLALGLSAACVRLALQERRFIYFLYAVGYGYLAFSIWFVDNLLIGGISTRSAYFLFSSAAVIYGVFRFRKLLEQRE